MVWEWGCHVHSVAQWVKGCDCLGGVWVYGVENDMGWFFGWEWDGCMFDILFGPMLGFRIEIPLHDPLS